MARTCPDHGHEMTRSFAGRPVCPDCERDRYVAAQQSV